MIPRATAVSVSATQAWQSTGIAVTSPVVIAYQDGLWSADPATNGGSPYDANGCPGIIVPVGQTCYPITGVAMGALVGRLGSSGTPFLVGDGPYTVNSDLGGVLELCINDDLDACYGRGLADNSGAVNVFIYPANTLPDLSVPLATDPAQTSPPALSTQLGPLQHLIGTWTNKPLTPGGAGGQDNPYSYNVMPLPQTDPSSPYGYILKNFTYYEELTFTAIHGPVLNRGGDVAQVTYTLFYEQRVYFAEGPAANSLVHAENGSLLFLAANQPQILGPYGNGDRPGIGNRTIPLGPTPPASPFNVVKQVAVPHGNSVLSLGSSINGMGAPLIAPVTVLPMGVDTAPYGMLDPVMNPQPAYTLDPASVLNNALTVLTPTNFIEIALSSANGAGVVSNIGFEQKHASVIKYDFKYWLESFDGGTSYPQLQYLQSIDLAIPIKGTTVAFPHVTVNTLTKTPS
jgi:hypothetical protein